MEWGLEFCQLLTAVYPYFSRLAGSKTEHDEQPQNNYDSGARWGHDNLSVPAETFIGIALINKAREKWIEIKLEQIADALNCVPNKCKSVKLNSKYSRYFKLPAPPSPR